MLKTSTAPGIQSAITDLEKLSADQEFREILRLREADIAVRNTEKILAHQEGLEQGLEQGEWNKAIKTAKNLMAMGLSIKEIAQATELPFATVQAIKDGKTVV